MDSLRSWSTPLDAGWGGRLGRGRSRATVQSGLLLLAGGGSGPGVPPPRLLREVPEDEGVVPPPEILDRERSMESPPLDGLDEDDPGIEEQEGLLVTSLLFFAVRANTTEAALGVIVP